MLVSIPIGMSGSYWIYVRTDSDNAVYEGAAENNNGSSLIPIHVLQRIADLQVTSITAPSSICRRQTITVQWVVKKRWAGRTKRQRFGATAFYFSTDPTSARATFF